jgi:hypothetical protein
MVQARISEMFAPEANAGIRVFSGGKDLIDIADMAAEERDAVTYCFDQTVKKIESVSPKIAAGLRPQREAMVKFAQIAKGTFPETKTYSYPGQAGGLAVDFLNPYLLGWGSPQTTGGNHNYLNTAGANANTTVVKTWDTSLTAGTVKYLLGYDATYPWYHGCTTTGTHSYVVLFQDGIIEIGTEPALSELFFKSQLMDKYTPISVPPLINQSIEEGRSIFQYTTPGMIPISHQTGVNIQVLPTVTKVAHMPLLGMVFYESDFNISTMTDR